MAKKIEQWEDNEGMLHDTEIEALTSDFCTAREDDDDTLGLTCVTVEAIDALHEYAHRGDAYANVVNASGKVVAKAYPVGVTIPKRPDESGANREPATAPRDERFPPECDDLQKKLDYLTARVTEDDVRALRAGDEVRIGLEWWRVTYASATVVELGLTGGREPLYLENITTIANEARYNGR